MASYLRLFGILLVGYGFVFAAFVPHYYYFDRNDQIVIYERASVIEILLVSLAAGGILAALSTAAFALSEGMARWLRRPSSSDDVAIVYRRTKATPSSPAPSDSSSGADREPRPTARPA